MINTEIIQKILGNSDHHLVLFTQGEIEDLEQRIFMRTVKGGKKPFLKLQHFLMIPSCFTESDVEDAACDWLESLDWSIAHGPDIAPDVPDAERANE